MGLNYQDLAIDLKRRNSGDSGLEKIKNEKYAQGSS